MHDYPPIILANGHGELRFQHVLLMGIVNITPDSFYDGGRYDDTGAALAHMRGMAAAGADIIDIGGASSRPGYTPLDAELEIRRILPVFEAAADLEPPLSVDTDQPQVAAAALAAGAALINNCGRLSAEMAAVAAEYDAPLVLMQREGFRSGADVIAGMREFFSRTLAFAERHGLRREQLILDPGLGFNKNAEQSMALLRHMDELLDFERPLLIGASRKRFVGVYYGGDTAGQRLSGSVQAALEAARRGAAILRVHDVAETAAALAGEDG
ncbi:MAG: dihydropteroate synthase [Bacillota bacterium]|nr:dihydropteroate synthase [Bacillota bacterium]